MKKHITKEAVHCLNENTLILTKTGVKEIKIITSEDYVWTNFGWAKIV